MGGAIRSWDINVSPRGIFFSRGARAQPLLVGERSVDLLTRRLGFPRVPDTSPFARPGVKFQSYPGLAHSSSPEEIEDLKTWLTEALK